MAMIYIKIIVDLYLTFAYTFIQYKTVYSKSDFTGMDLGVNNTTEANGKSEIPILPYYCNWN